MSDAPDVIVRCINILAEKYNCNTEELTLIRALNKIKLQDIQIISEEKKKKEKAKIKADKEKERQRKKEEKNKIEIKKMILIQSKSVQANKYLNMEKSFQKNSIYKKIENFKYQEIITSIPFICPVENLSSILEHKYIYTNQSRINNKIHAVSGFGDAMAQNLIDSKTRFEIQRESPGMGFIKNGKIYDDTFGLTVGCMCYGDDNYSNNRVVCIKKSQYTPEMCCIFINPNVLKQTYYHVNLGDNNGFYMYADQKYYYKPLSDARDMSYTDDTIHELSPEIYENYKKDIEIYIEESISTDYFIEIGFIDLNTLLMYKNVLNSLNIKCSMFDENTCSFNIK